MAKSGDIAECFEIPCGGTPFRQRYHSIDIMEEMQLAIGIGQIDD